MMFGPAPNTPQMMAAKGEARRILAMNAPGQVSDQDTGRLSALVSGEDGISVPAATSRVTDAEARWASAAHDARRTATITALWTAIALLFGMIVAVAAAISARWQDDKINFGWKAAALGRRRLQKAAHQDLDGVQDLRHVQLGIADGHHPRAVENPEQDGGRGFGIEPRIDQSAGLTFFEELRQDQPRVAAHLAQGFGQLGIAVSLGRQFQKQDKVGAQIAALGFVNHRADGRERIAAFHQFTELSRAFLKRGLADGIEDRLLAGEIMIKEAWADARFGADIGDGGASETLAREASLGRVQDFLPLLLMLDGVEAAQPKGTSNLECLI